MTQTVDSQEHLVRAKTMNITCPNCKHSANTKRAIATGFKITCRKCQHSWTHQGVSATLKQQVISDAAGFGRAMAKAILGIAFLVAVFIGCIALLICYLGSGQTTAQPTSPASTPAQLNQPVAIQTPAPEAPVPTQPSTSANHGTLTSFEEHPPCIAEYIKTGKEVWLLDGCYTGTDELSPGDKRSLYAVFSKDTLAKVVFKDHTAVGEDNKQAHHDVFGDDLENHWYTTDPGDEKFGDDPIDDIITVMHWEGRKVGQTLILSQKTTNDHQSGKPGDEDALKIHMTYEDTIRVILDKGTWDLSSTFVKEQAFIGPVSPFLLRNANKMD